MQICVSIVFYFCCLSFCIANLTYQDCHNFFLTDCCNRYHLVDHRCVPFCSEGCPEGHICTRPNDCELIGSNERNESCNPTLEDLYDVSCMLCIGMFENITNICQPYCGQKCSDVPCFTPCDCNAGYAHNYETGNCEPLESFEIDSTSATAFTTTSDTQNPTTDTTTENNNSNCLDGLCQKQTSSTEDTTEHKSTISPLVDVTSNCQNGCWGGICYEGICQCKEGLILDVELNDCIMPCESTCQNGVCNQDRKCECNQGFVFQDQSGCVPQCDHKCVNSVCVAPTHCECVEGDISKLNVSSVLECLPTCEGVAGEADCQNGTCVAVNKCQCLDGFFPNPHDRYECIVNLDHHALNFTSKLLFLIAIIVILTVLTILAIGHLARKRLRCVSYNIGKIEKFHSAAVEFQNHEQLDSVL